MCVCVCVCVCVCSILVSLPHLSLSLSLFLSLTLSFSFSLRPGLKNGGIIIDAERDDALSGIVDSHLLGTNAVASVCYPCTSNTPSPF